MKFKHVVKNKNVVAATAAIAILVASCGSSSSSTGGGAGGKALGKLGAAEGTVNVVAWPGYVEKGETDKAVDWITGFEKSSGCKVNVKVGATSDEMVQLMKTGEYDVVSASGDATLRLIAGGDVAPVNTALIPNYADVFEGLKNKAWNSKGGKAYGVPHGRGANLLMYRTDVFATAPDSWSVVWDTASPAKGKITSYDSPIYIADAAVYLMATKPDLAIKNPYALDDKQFAAAVALLKAQKPLVAEYWSDYLKQVEGFKSGTMAAGTTWQVTANVLTGEKAPIGVTLPKEGSTGWSDTWMVSSKAKNPTCAYQFLNHIISPEANAQATEYFGEAPANKKSCALTTDKEHCKTFHADDEAYFKNVWYWNTPTKECLDGRGPKCMDYAEWTKAWTEIKG
jgi:putative spermidine/putrescine transport system substrate-binding protein